jgi:hypothetical protein
MFLSCDVTGRSAKAIACSSSPPPVGAAGDGIS